MEAAASRVRGFGWLVGCALLGLAVGRAARSHRWCPMDLKSLPQYPDSTDEGEQQKGAPSCTRIMVVVLVVILIALFVGYLCFLLMQLHGLGLSGPMG
jgi:hypothetical protein